MPPTSAAPSEAAAPRPVPETRPTAAAPRTGERAPETPRVTAGVEPKATPQKPAPASPPASPGAPESTSGSPSAGPRDVPASPGVAVQKSAPASPAAPPAPAKASEPAASAIEATPQAVQDIVSKLKLQMVVYSDTPSQRLVFINNQKYLEGSAVDGQLRVETITPDGAVLTFQGKRFQLRQ